MSPQDRDERRKSHKVADHKPLYKKWSEEENNINPAQSYSYTQLTSASLYESDLNRPLYRVPSADIRKTQSPLSTFF